MTIHKIGFIAAATLMAGSAFAQSDQFSALDIDASGGLSLSEVQAIAPNLTAEDVAAYDADGSGELSRDEFDAWIASLQPE